MSRARVVLAVSLVACALAGCTRRGGDGRSGATGAASSSAASAPSGPVAKRADGEPKAGGAVVMDFLKGFDACTLGHRGVLLDLGDATMRARVRTGAELETRERDGASWLVLRERGASLSFVSPSEVHSEVGLAIEARVRGGAAKNLSVFLNGKPLGALSLTRGEVKVASLRATGASIARGTNELSLRASGTGRAAKESKEQLAEIDWIRVGPYDNEGPYAAPTRGDALTTVTLGGVARRGLSLRAPGFARCTGWVPNGAVLEGWVGVAGGGEAEIEVRVLVDRAEPRVVGSVQLGAPLETSGPSGAPVSGTAWRPIALPLGDVGTIAAVELVAKSSAKGARVVFAEPRVVLEAPRETPAPPTAKGVLLVVLGSTPRRALAPWGGTVTVPELAQLGAGGLVFDAHRASTSFAAGSLASMLTGLSTKRHGVSDAEAAVPAGTPLLAETTRRAGVMTAMFTANPTTSSAFGFARGWETFEAKTPLDDEPATALYDHAARWLDAHKQERFFVVLHTRGGHPPWDVGSDQLKDLPPASYVGSLDAKHAGEMLGKARKPGSARLTEADRTRAFALHERALAANDEALGRLLAHLRAIGRDGDTVVIVTGDVGFDPGATIPFLEGESLEETTLALPLVVKAPGVAPARVTTPTSSVDVARTVLEALGLAAPSELEGVSLWGLRGAARTSEVPAVAAAGPRSSARWGGFVLAAARDRETRLCNLALEPDCASDVRASHPLASEVMHAIVFDELARTKPAPTPLPATAASGATATPAAGRPVDVRENRTGLADPAVAAALKAWGR